MSEGYTDGHTKLDKRPSEFDNISISSGHKSGKIRAQKSIDDGESGIFESKLKYETKYQIQNLEEKSMGRNWYLEKEKLKYEMLSKIISVIQEKNVILYIAISLLMNCLARNIYLWMEIFT